jgi:hypothetical protein
VPFILVEETIGDSSFGGHDNKEEKREEAEDEEAPPPPEMIAASFEEARPELIGNDDYAPVLADHIAAPFEECNNEEEKFEESEDDETPPSPRYDSCIIQSDQCYQPENRDAARIDRGIFILRAW